MREARRPTWRVAISPCRRPIIKTAVRSATVGNVGVGGAYGFLGGVDDFQGDFGADVADAGDAGVEEVVGAFVVRERVGEGECGGFDHRVCY